MIRRYESCRARPREALRRAGWLAGLCVAAACATAPAAPPETVPVWIVDDGTHEGILLPAAAAPLRPDVRFPMPGARVAFLEYGYSDRSWIEGTGRTLAHIWELAVSSGLGVLVVLTYPDLETALAGKTHRLVHCTPEQIRGLSDELCDWTDGSGSVGIIEGARPMYVIDSTKPYTLTHNCHRFASRVLARMNIDLDDDADEADAIEPARD